LLASLLACLLTYLLIYLKTKNIAHIHDCFIADVAANDDDDDDAVLDGGNDGDDAVLDGGNDDDDGASGGSSYDEVADERINNVDSNDSLLMIELLMLVSIPFINVAKRHLTRKRFLAWKKGEGKA